MAEEPLYRKVGKRYERVGDFHLNPAPGVWLVEDEPGRRSKRWIMRIGELPDAVPLIKIERKYRDKVCSAVVRKMNDLKRWNINDVVTEVFKELARDEKVV